MSKPTVTHNAFVLKRDTRRNFRWLEVGVAELHLDAKSGSHHVYLDRLPVGGFTGHIVLHPTGSQPPIPLPAPERPGEGDPDQ